MHHFMLHIFICTLWLWTCLHVISRSHDGFHSTNIKTCADSPFRTCQGQVQLGSQLSYMIARPGVLHSTHLSYLKTWFLSPLLFLTSSWNITSRFSGEGAYWCSKSWSPPGKSLVTSPNGDLFLNTWVVTSLVSDSGLGCKFHFLSWEFLFLRSLPPGSWRKRNLHLGRSRQWVGNQKVSPTKYIHLTWVPL